jgi:hypothetical protein
MSTIAFAGEYSLTRAEITSYNGAAVSIMELIHEITIYEDIYSPFLTMEVLIEDQIGLYHKLPIIGEETLTVTITNTDGEFGYKDFTFSVFKTKDFLEKGQRGFIYKMCCISTEAIKDMNIKLSKSYKGTAKDIAQNILVKEGLTTTKKVIVEETDGTLAYISNYWPPIKNLKYLCQRAVSKISKSPSFMFFENKYGFYFTSLATLKGQAPIGSYFYSANPGTDVAESLQRVEAIYIDRGIDYIEKIQNGAYGSNVVYVDPTRKSYMYKYLDFLQMFNSQPRMNSLPYGTQDATRRVNGTFNCNITPTYARNGMKDEYSERWFQERLGELSTLRSFEIQIEVPGTLEVAVGQTTDFYMYSGDVPDSSNTNSSLDPVFSGRYLITGINHSFNRTRHVMLLTLSKDSLIKASA